jgi:hypothetical protein
MDRMGLRSIRAMMSKIFLTIILALALAVQGTSISIQIESDHVVGALVQTRHDIHIASNDLDDEQRGAKFHPTLSSLPFEVTSLTNLPHWHTEVNLPASKRSLFKLKAVLLI